MAMVVKNNMSAVNTLNILNKNQSALAKSLQKVSSGMKINTAGDDASGYAISEFRVTLNMDYEISHQLLPLYNYAYDRLVEGNMKSDPAIIQEATDIITELRDAWVQAMKTAREEKGAQGMEGSGVYAG